MWRRIVRRRRGAGEAAEESAEHGARAGREAAEETTESAGRVADDVVDEASEHVPYRRDPARKLREYPEALAQARVITETNDVVNTPVPVLLRLLNALRRRYSWIRRFVARRLGVGYYSIRMNASDREVGPYRTDDNTTRTVINSFDEVADYISRNGKLPDNYITKAEASVLGWKPKKGNLADVASGKSIGGDIFRNVPPILPNSPGRIWREADIDYISGFRGAKRILYSNDGLIYKSLDHYKTAIK